MTGPSAIPEEVNGGKNATHVSAQQIAFLMVGTQRGGTTWVDKALRGHPEIHLPTKKQTYFFDSNFNNGLDWYLQQFGDVNAGKKAIGEIATDYCLEDPFPKVVKAFPHIKILLSVRNPTERAYSYYQSRKAQFEWDTFEEAVEQDPRILQRGRYIEIVERIRSAYPEDRFLLLFFDDLQSDDRSYLRSILEFLEIDPNYESPVLGRKVQVSAFARTRRLMSRVGGQALVDWVSQSWIGDQLRAFLRHKDAQKVVHIDPDIKRFLDDYYRPLNQRLATYAGRSLDHWG